MLWIDILKNQYSYLFLVLWLLLLLYFNKDVDRFVQRSFYYLILISFLLFCLDYLSDYAVNIPNNMKWCSRIAFLQYALKPSLLYMVLTITRKSKAPGERILQALPLLFFIVILVVSYPFHLVFYFSAPNNTFHSGRLLPITWLILLVYMGLIIRSAISSHCSRKECFSLLLGEAFIALNIVRERIWNIAIPGMEHTVIILAILIYYQYFCSRCDSELQVKRNAELTRAKTQAMISQIKPHFIYNSLACIAEVCHEGSPEGEQAILSFSSYLRNCFQSLSEDGLIPFSEELATIRHYLDLEMLQSPDKLSVLYDIQEQHFQVPILAIETLVENAVKHGIRKKHGPGIVILRTFRDEEGIHIQIEDDGIGFDTLKQLPDENHLGLENSRIRLKEQCQARMSVTSLIEKGTKIAITIQEETHK